MSHSDIPVSSAPLTVSLSAELGHLRDPFHVRSERLRHLRTEILQNAGQPNTLALAMVSGTAKDGRTRLSAELAYLLSLLGDATLLVDADFRKPRMQALFTGEKPMGFSECLQRGRPTPVASVQGAPQLQVVFAGALPTNPMELLLSPAAEAQFRQWQTEYRYIIIDTAVLGEHSDALAVGALAGNIWLCNREAHSSLPALKVVRQRLHNARLPIIGASLERF